MIEYTLEVPGMTCKGCEIAITEEASELSEVSHVEADSDAGRVVVECSPGAKRSVRNVIESVGYDVRE